MTKTTQDYSTFSEAVRESLRELRRLFSGLSDSTLRKIPADHTEEVQFGREVASMVVTLAIFNEVLLRRLFNGARLPHEGVNPVVPADFDWVKLPSRQPRSAVAERKIRELLDRLAQQIGCLDDESLMQLPPAFADIPEFLTLSIMVQSHLAWYVDVCWFPKTFSLKPGD